MHWDFLLSENLDQVWSLAVHSVTLPKLQLLTNGLIASDSGGYANIYENLCIQE